MEWTTEFLKEWKQQPNLWTDSRIDPRWINGMNITTQNYTVRSYSISLLNPESQITLVLQRHCSFQNHPPCRVLWAAGDTGKKDQLNQLWTGVAPWFVAKSLANVDYMEVSQGHGVPPMIRVMNDHDLVCNPVWGSSILGKPISDLLLSWGFSQLLAARLRNRPFIFFAGAQPTVCSKSPVG